MKEPTEYLQLASNFEAAADASSDQSERQNLRDLARIYFTLATTASAFHNARALRRTDGARLASGTNRSDVH